MSTSGVNSMRQLTHHHLLRGRLILIAVLLLVLSIAFIVVTQRVAADDGQQPGQGKRLLTIHDRGKELGFITDATSIKSALESAKITLGENDLVEPALDEELVAESYHINIYRARPVVIIDGAVSQRVLTPYQTSRQIVEDAGMTLQKEDTTQVEPVIDTTAHGAGLQVTITRATPFTLVLYGKQTQAYSRATSVNEMLKEKDITIGDQDTLSVSRDAPLQSGMIIELWRNGKQTITEDQAIDFPVEQVQDTDRDAGYKQVQTAGEKGSKTVTYEVVMKNGQEESRREIQTVVTKEPKKQIEVVGAKPSFSGDFAAALAKLRQCEAGGNYANKRNPSYRGAYQFGYTTWGNYGGYYDPADAPPAVQDEAARKLYERRGWQPWPHCGSTLPDTFR